MKIWTREHDLQGSLPPRSPFPTKSEVSPWSSECQGWGNRGSRTWMVQFSDIWVEDRFLLASNERKAMLTVIKVAGSWGDFYHSKPCPAAKISKIINLNYDSYCYSLIMKEICAHNRKLSKGQKSTKQQMKSSSWCYRATKGLSTNCGSQNWIHRPPPPTPTPASRGCFTHLWDVRHTAGVQ